MFAKAGKKKKKGRGAGSIAGCQRLPRQRWRSSRLRGRIPTVCTSERQSDRVCETEWKRLGSLIQSTLLFLGRRALLQSSPFRYLLGFFPANFFFFPGETTQKKKKKGNRHLIASREREKEVGKGKARRGGGTGSRRGSGRPLCAEWLGPEDGARGGRAKPLRCPALPQRARLSPARGHCPVPVSSARPPPSPISPRPGRAGRRGGLVAGFLEVVVVVAL